MGFPLDQAGERVVFLDGAMGTSLAAAGCDPTPLSNLENPETVKKITGEFIAAGSVIVQANTFSATPFKFKDYERINSEGVRIARSAVESSGKSNVRVAGSVGPTGKMVIPVGELGFEEAVDLFSRQIRVLSEEGAELLIIETMDDIQEMRAALIAAAETAPSLDIIATMTFSGAGRSSTGTPPESAAAVMDALGASVIGVNCSFGPGGLEEVIRRMRPFTRKPLAAQANAGIPKIEGDRTVFPLGPGEYAEGVLRLAEAGASVLGGCCGAGPGYIREVVKRLKDFSVPPPPEEVPPVITSRTGWVSFAQAPVIIGERINLISRPELAGSSTALAGEARRQVEAGAEALDVCPGKHEDRTEEIVGILSEKTSAPLVLDSQNPRAVEAAARVYPGLFLLNSIPGEKKKMDELIPLAEKYGMPFIGLCTDERGVASTHERKLEIAEKIITYAGKHIDENKVIIDPVVLAVSSDTASASLTLKALGKLGRRSLLGISNVSSGMPQRALLNQVFASLAVKEGVSALIVNPLDADLVYAVYAAALLSGRDPGGRRYLDFFSPGEEDFKFTDPLSQALIDGDAEAGVSEAEKRIAEKQDPLEIINTAVLPALEKAGELYERRVYFLPQLISTARCAEKVLGVLESNIPPETRTPEKKVLIATVEGDIHDIGKNLVALMLRNHSCRVLDLGVDVPAGKIIEEARRFGADLIALSALMTNTASRMAETAALIKSGNLDIPLLIGGAAVTEKFASGIGARYSQDAVSAVKTAGEIFSQK